MPPVDYHAADHLDIYDMPGHLIRRLNQASIAIFDNKMRARGYDLTPVQFAALTKIAHDPGVDQASLAQAIAYDRVTIGGVIDRLEQKGLVRRTIDQRDRRARRLTLLPKGAHVLAAVRPIVNDLQNDILAGLSAEETALLCRLLRKALDEVGDVSRTPQRSEKSA